MYKEKIDQFIDAHVEEMLDDIKELCEIDSARTSYREGMPFGKGCFEALVEALGMGERHGFSVMNYDNYVGVIDLNDKERQLDILAHLDVVPAGDGWTVTEPFSPLVKDGKIYGRGTADDKGPAVAAFYAMRAVKELNIPLKKNVRLILGTDEECGSSDIEHYYRQEPEAPMTFSPDSSFPVVNVEKGMFQGKFTAEFSESSALPRLVSLSCGTKVNVVPGKAEALFEGVTGEEAEAVIKAVEGKTGLTFQVDSEKGFLRITAVGENGHAARPHLAKNALTGLLELIAALPLADCGQVRTLKELSRLMPHGDWFGKNLGVSMEDEISGPLTLSLNMLQVNETTLQGAFDSRIPVCATRENTLLAVKKTLADHGLNLTTDSILPAHHVSGDSEFVKTLLKWYEAYTGKKGECVSTGGLTYVHDLKNGVVFGASMPGTDNHMHGPDEFAVIDELVLCAKMFAQVIVDLCS